MPRTVAAEEAEPRSVEDEPVDGTQAQRTLIEADAGQEQDVVVSAKGPKRVSWVQIPVLPDVDVYPSHPAPQTNWPPTALTRGWFRVDLGT